MGVEKYRNGFDLTLHESALEEPLRWKKPRLVVRELDERPVPRIRPRRIHRVGVPHHESGDPTHVSGAHEAPGPSHGTRPRTDLDAEYLAGHEHRIQRVARPIGEAERN